jgi:tetratricopeptide (TPR) repeat protein/TolB-like protein
LPTWSEKFATFAVIGGFPLVILIAWSFEFVKGRIHTDRGEQSGGLLQGLERNYLAIFISFGIAAIGAGVYQASVGFDVPPPPAPAQAEDELIPVVDNSIAVLRLETFDRSQQAKAFSDGLSEDIIDGLARIPGLFVTSRGDSWSLPPNAPSDLVRRRLRVANYIEGSVRFLDDKLKVVVQLINSETGFHRFSRNFEIDVTSTGQMQREVTELVVANLKLAVDTRTLDAGTYSTVVDNRDAYMLYMLGREAAHRPMSRANLDEAIDYFEQALEIDADYPAAYAGLCGAHVTLYELVKDAASIANAEAACAAALNVAPQLPVVLNNVGRLYRQTGKLDDAERVYLEALAANERDAAAMRGLAVIRRNQQRYEEAEDLMRRSIELQPGNWLAINGLGNLYFNMGQFANAAAEYRRVLFLDPDNFVTLGNLASTSLMAGNFADARDALQQSIEIEENPTHVTNLGIAYYYLGDLDEAIEIFRRAVELVPNDESNLIALADALHAAGRTNEAVDIYRKARELAASHLELAGDDVDYMTSLAWTTAMTGDVDRGVELAQRAVELDPAYPYSHYYEALVQVRAGRPDEAIDACRLALQGGYPVAMLAAEPMLDELRGDPRFARLVAEHNEGGKER